MTTAHRPTYNSAIGMEDEGSNRFLAPSKMHSAKDLPGHLTLKTRKPGQNTQAELASREDLKTQLESAEAKHLKVLKGDIYEADEPVSQPEKTTAVIDPEDADDIETTDRHIDEEDSDDDESDDDDDDEAELLAELERIKRERAEDAVRQEKEKAAQDAEENNNAVLRGNPLINGAAAAGGTFNVKRRWDDDVVFKNQAKEEKKVAKRFINDTVRNDFHRKFLEKYIK